MPYRVEQWSVCSALKGVDAFLPPEAGGIAIQAKSSDRPGFETGITTSRITRIEGRVVTTRTGSQYLLGEPEPAYVNWCLAHSVHDPRDPLCPIRTIHE